MIQVEGLTKRYARAVAVDHISFNVSKGQIVGFLGPNGAGKTTTMRMLTCFMPPTDGRANVAGFDCVEKPQEVKKRIGYLPETPPLYPDMSVAEYLLFVGDLKGLNKADLPKRVDDVMKKCAVDDVRDKLINKLSKGYRQRVGLAQAIIHNPDVLILDEPTSGLDPRQIRETRQLIKGLAGEHTIILSTHILPEVEAICEHIVMIARGQLRADDSLANLSARGVGAVDLEVQPREGALDLAQVKRTLEAVSGVRQVNASELTGNRGHFEILSQDGHDLRGDIARAVVAAGLNLNELRSGLEKIYLQLTGDQAVAPKEGDSQ
ncbi:MAG: ABC transporter ATP-binding protein [Bryobacteraceae bacterium]|nr:ABC transporter ATP-binding protein [Bryobacteraceae bacterium]